MNLADLFRPDRNLLKLICHPSRASLEGEIFEFVGPLFISEVFRNLLAEDCDLSVLDSAFLNDIWFQELPLLHGLACEQEVLDAELKAVDIQKFEDLLLIAKKKLLENLVTQDVRLGYRRSGGADETVENRYVDEQILVTRIEKALNFIARTDGVYTLVIDYVDDWV